MHQHSARVSGTRNSRLRNACQRGAEVLAVGKVHLAYALGRSRANQLNLPQELNVELHATLTLLARRVQEEMKRLIEQPATGHRSRPAGEHALAELPASPTESPLADVQGFLATQILGLFFGEGIGLVGSRLGGHYPFQTMTSSSSSKPKARCTRSRTSAISPSISAARAWPSLTKKLAWRSLTRASPTRWLFRPSSSIIRPAEAPGGFLKMQPALF